ncbi:unnamed protein product [Agarophyton chilense]
MGVRNVFPTTYHPQCNGQVERFNRTLIAALRHYIVDHPKEWDMFTDTLCYAYNTQVHTSTKTAPFDLVLSCNPPALPVALDLRTELDAPTPAKYHLKWRNDLKARAEEAAKELSKTRARYKRIYDARRRRRNPAIRVGGHVFVRVERPDKQEDSSHKLLPIAAGPFKVVVLDEDTVVIKTGEDVERVSRDRVEVAPDPQVEVQVSGRTKETSATERQCKSPSDSGESEPPPMARAEEKAPDLPPPAVAYANHGQLPKYRDMPRGTRTPVSTEMEPESRKDVLEFGPNDLETSSCEHAPLPLQAEPSGEAPLAVPPISAPIPRGQEEEEVSPPVVVQAPSPTEQRSESDTPKEVHPRMELRSSKK